MSKRVLNRVPTVFQKALGDTFELLPEAVAQLHSVHGQATYQGRATVRGARGITGRITAQLLGFPGDMDDVPVRVSITTNEQGEKWERDFAGTTMRSHLSVDGDGFAQERFGPLSFRLGLSFSDNKLYYPVIRGRVFGIVPVPPLLLPVSIAHETVDNQGRFRFDVLAKTPFGARIVHYRGWLVRAGDH